VLVGEFSPSLTLGRVHEAQSGRLRLDAFPWTQHGTLPVKVTQVATEVRDNFVRVQFALTPEAIRSGVVQHGLLGTVEVAVESVSPATLVMRAAGMLLSTARGDLPAAETGR
jgi:membrane fusion protein (multidrug efflux system)